MQVVVTPARQNQAVMSVLISHKLPVSSWHPTYIIDVGALVLFSQAALKLRLPVTGTVGLTTIVLVSAFVFKLPEEYFTIGRSYKNTAADERAFLYSNIESMLDGLDQLSH